MRVLIFIPLFVLSMFRQAPAQQLLAKYTFDNTPQDFSGNNNHGVIHGSITPTMDRFGNHCGAYLFDGSGYIEVPTSPSLEMPSGTITITAWYRITQQRKNQWITVLCKGKSNLEGPDNPQYRLQVQQNTSPLVNKCAGNQAGGSSTISLNTSFTKCDLQFEAHPIIAGQWAFYALVFDGAQVVAYMNGEKVFTTTHSIPLQKNSLPLFIGFDEPGQTEYFEGALDDIHIYNGEMDEKAIRKLFNEARPSQVQQEEFTASRHDNMTTPLPPNACQAKIDFKPPAVTATSCGKVTVAQLAGPTPGTALSPGRYPVTYRLAAESGYAQHQTFFVEVKDLTAPTLRIPEDTTLIIPAGSKQAAWQYKPVATDNCNIRSVTLIKGNTAGAALPTGRHILTYQATDQAGNVTTRSMTVKVKEASAPPKLDTPVQQTPPPVVTTPPVTPPPPPPVIRDTPIAAPDFPLPPDFQRRSFIEQKSLEVNSTHLRIVMYDNGVYDGDTVSLILNGRVIIQHEEVKIKGKEFFIDIDTTRDNELIMYAENEGSIKPNTASIDLYDGTIRHEINLSSSLSKSGLIRIRKRKNTP